MPNSIRLLAFGLVALAGLGFLWCILSAGYYTLWVEGAPKPDLMPDFLAENATAIGAVLGTNLGAALGIRGTVGQWRKNSDHSETLRIIAAWFYVGALVLALVLWGFSGFGEDPKEVVATLQELSRSLGGVVVGTLAVMLGVTT